MARRLTRNDWIVIGVSGVTCGGKTTLSHRLRDILHPVYVFHQDKYFYPDDSPKHVKCHGIDHNNYDILESLDMEAMLKDVLSTISGTDCSHERNIEYTPDKTEIQGKRFLIVEGFTVLNYQPLKELCHLKYFLTLPYGECAARRAFRLYDPPDVPGYFEQCVWPEYCKYKAEIDLDPSIRILDGTAPHAHYIVMEDVTKLGGKKIPATTDE